MKSSIFFFFLFTCFITKVQPQGGKIITNGYYHSSTYQDLFKIESKNIFGNGSISVLVGANSLSTDVDQVVKKEHDAFLLLTKKSKLTFFTILKDIQPNYLEWIAKSDTTELFFTTNFLPLVLIPNDKGYFLQKDNEMIIYFLNTSGLFRNILIQITSTQSIKSTDVVKPYILNFSFQTIEEINDFINAIDEIYCIDSAIKTQNP